MKKKYIATLMLFMFLGLIIPYDAYGVSLSDIVLENDKNETELCEELVEINDNLDYGSFQDINDLEYYKYFLELKGIYDFLSEYCDVYSENTQKVEEEVLNENLTILNSLINYLDKNSYLQDLINDEVKEKFEALSENEVINLNEIKDILENIILFYEDNKEADEVINVFEEIYESKEEYIVGKELNTATEDENNYCENSMCTEYIYDLGEYENVYEDKANLWKNILNSREVEDNYKRKVVSNEEELNILKTSAQDNVENKNSDYKVNVLDLEITKDNTNKLKITFKIDNDLDLKNENNDLKIYIANNTTGNKEILITKDKTLEKYLYLENVISLSGEALKLGKDDTLLDGVYTVVLSDKEQEQLNGVGLENLIVKVEVIFNSKSSSLVGYLKDDTIESSSNENIEEKESQESNSITTSTNNEKNENSNKEVLPKTGIFLGNYLSLAVGILSILLGSFLVGYKKIGY